MKNAYTRDILGKLRDNAKLIYNTYLLFSTIETCKDTYHLSFYSYINISNGNPTKNPKLYGKLCITRNGKHILMDDLDDELKQIGTYFYELMIINKKLQDSTNHACNIISNVINEWNNENEMILAQKQYHFLKGLEHTAKSLFEGYLLTSSRKFVVQNEACGNSFYLEFYSRLNTLNRGIARNEKYYGSILISCSIKQVLINDLDKDLLGIFSYFSELIEIVENANEVESIIINNVSEWTEESISSIKRLSENTK